LDLTAVTQVTEPRNNGREMALSKMRNAHLRYHAFVINVTNSERIVDIFRATKDSDQKSAETV
jgi:hypothetical protein